MENINEQQSDDIGCDSKESTTLIPHNFEQRKSNSPLPDNGKFWTMEKLQQVLNFKVPKAAMRKTTKLKLVYMNCK